MKIFQNKIVVGVICIVIAAILAFFFLPSISKIKSNTEMPFVSNCQTLTNAGKLIYNSKLVNTHYKKTIQRLASQLMLGG